MLRWLELRWLALDAALGAEMAHGAARWVSTKLGLKAGHGVQLEDACV